MLFCKADQLRTFLCDQSFIGSSKMTDYIVKSDDSKWYVYISKTEGWSLTGCAEIAHKFGNIESAEKMAEEINHNHLFEKHQMRVEVAPDSHEKIKDNTEMQLKLF